MLTRKQILHSVTAVLVVICLVGAFHCIQLNNYRVQKIDQLTVNRIEDLPSNYKHGKWSVTHLRSSEVLERRTPGEVLAKTTPGEVLERRMPRAIVAGAGKCGTDALAAYLNTSDEFKINTFQNAHLEELNFFNYNYDKGRQFYIGSMPLTTHNQVTIEKCAPYLWNPEVPRRVRDTNPNMKIIIVLCDPVKRLVSLYTHINSYKMEDGTEPLPSVDELLYVDSGKIAERVHPRLKQPFLESGKYINFIKQWLQYFPLSQIHIVSGEQLISNPLPEILKVTSFLDHPDAITSENVYFNATHGFYCFRARGTQWCMDRQTKGRRHPKLSSEMLKSLQQHFDIYNHELYTVLDRDFGWPTYFGQSDSV